MALFTIDESKCVRDGVCSDVCPAGLIKDGVVGFPVPIPNAEDACIHCWHCVMCCPTEAFVHQSMSPSSCLDLSREGILPLDQLERLYTSRKSTRAFLPRPVSRDIVTKLLELSQRAPSAHNQRRLEWVVIDDRATIRDLARKTVDLLRRRIESGAFSASRHLSVFADSWLDQWENGTDVILRDAPVVILCHMPGESTSSADCSIALTYVELAAASIGLSTCWAGFFHGAVNSYKPVMDVVDLPEGNTCVGAMVLGYPKHQKARLAPSKPLKVRWV